MLKPIGSRLIIEPQVSEEKTAGGIILPESAQEKPQKGKVVAIGSGKFLDNGQQEKIDLQVGDVVYFSKYSPTEVKIDDKELYIVSFSDVLAVEE